MYTLPTEDLEYIYDKIKEFIHVLKGKKILLTGGTGFFGMWLLESFIYFNSKAQLNARIYILTRDLIKYKEKAPHLFECIDMYPIEGNILDESFFENFQYPVDFIIHAATDASAELNANDPLLMFKTITIGTENILNFIKNRKIESFLLVSSGAVYGVQPTHISHLTENYEGCYGFDHGNAPYGGGKRVAELLCFVHQKQLNFDLKIARCFAFVGPYLPINSHFAIGNFIGNGLNNEQIEIKGDGTPLRSYMYASDLAIWLWTILIQGKKNVAYNVGSDESVSIEQTAKLVCACFDDKTDYIVRQQIDKTKIREQYVPSVDLAKKDLGLQVDISLKDAIVKTIDWHKNKS